MARLRLGVVGAFAASLLCSVAAMGQFVAPISDFESFTDFDEEVFFRNPGVSGTTSGIVTLPDTSLTYLTNVTIDTFSLASSGVKSVATFWQWQNSGFHASWVRLVTANANEIPNAALHLGGKVRFWAGATAYSDLNFVPVAGGSLYVGLGVRETGQGAPQGADGGVSGDVEWVGLGARLNEILAGADGIVNTTANALSDDVQVNPLAANVGPDGVCVDAGPDGILQTAVAGDDTGAVTPRGAATIPADGTMRLYEFDLTTGIVSVNGVPQGGIFATLSGDGVLGATPNNRGTLEHLALTNDPANAGVNANVFLVNIDDVEFEAPVLDPPIIINEPIPPRPLDESLDLDGVKATASAVEVYRFDNVGAEVLLASVNPAGDTSPTIMVPPLAANIRVFARQTVGADTSDNSTPVIVTSPGNGPLRIAMAVRETDAFDHGLFNPADPNCGANGTGFNPDKPSTLEFVGVSAQQGFGVPQAPRRTTSTEWFEVVFNPCDPEFGVALFSGNGALELNAGPDYTVGVWEGLYFRIDELSPTVGPYTVYIDDVIVKNGAGDGVDCVVDDFDSYTPGDFVVAGSDGDADTLATGDDVQTRSLGTTGLAPGDIIVSPGPDGVLDTAPATGDGLSQLHARFNSPGVAGTSVGLAPTPNVAAITDEQAFSGSNSMKIEFAFVDASNPSSVLRLTTNGTVTPTIPPETFLGPDPVIPFSLDGTFCDGSGDIAYSVMIKLEPPAVPADCDQDGDVDLLDYECLQRCAGETPVSGECAVFDIAPNGAPDDAINGGDLELYSFLMIGPQF